MRTKALLLCALLMCGCAGTVIQKEVRPSRPSYSGAVLDSGIKGFEPGYVIFNEDSRARYNALIERYGASFLPPLKKDDGLTPLPGSLWAIDNQHFAKAVRMNNDNRSSTQTHPRQ